MLSLAAGLLVGLFQPLATQAAGPATNNLPLSSRNGRGEDRQSEGRLPLPGGEGRGEGLDYSSFRIISDRNIFNSRRSARYVPSSTTRTRGSRSENFALVGTLSSDKGTVAFFDGSRPDYRKVLKPDEAIAGFKVVAIETSFVKLASPTNELELRLGMQLRREDEGEWHMSERPEVLEPAISRSSYSRSSYAPSTTPAPESGPQVAGDLPPPEGGFPPGLEGGPPVGFLVDPQTGLTNIVAPVVVPFPADNGAAPAAGGDILEVLRRRAAAERGDAQ